MIEGSSFHPISESWLQREKERIQRRSEMPNLQFFKFQSGQMASFYLLPPYNERGICALEVWKCFELPSRQRHTAFRTWEDRQPGIMNEDPVEDAIEKLSQVNETAARVMRPKASYHANILLIGTSDVDASGHVIPGTIRQPRELFVYTTRLPLTVWDEIVPRISDPRGAISNPQSAVRIFVTARGKDINTRYQVAFASRMGPDGVEVLEHEDLFQTYGAENMQKILSHLPDLDRVWPIPDEEARVKARIVADSILRLAVQSTQLGSSPVPQQPPSVQGEFFRAPSSPPPSPSFQTQTPSPPSFQAPSASPPGIPPSPPPPQSFQAPSASPPGIPPSPPPPQSFQAPSASPPGIPPGAPSPSPQPSFSPPRMGQVSQATNGVTMEDILSRSLGTEYPPQAGPAMPPPCFGRIHEVEKSPNAVWCGNCNYRDSCEMTATVAS
jgi:hypothetical protein